MERDPVVVLMVWMSEQLVLVAVEMTQAPAAHSR
jgi:hypothetical protein